VGRVVNLELFRLRIGAEHMQHIPIYLQPVMFYTVESVEAEQVEEPFWELNSA
jgi:hypothetical protein